MVRDKHGGVLMEGDYVRVLRGPDKGLVGKIIKVSKGWVWVEFEGGMVMRYRGKNLELHRPSFIP